MAESSPSLDTAPMASTPAVVPLKCVVHYPRVCPLNSKLVKMHKFSDKTWGNTIEAAEKWLQMREDNVIQQNIAKDILQNKNKSGYHKRCYSNFTSKKELLRAEYRKQKGVDKKVQSSKIKEPLYFKQKKKKRNYPTAKGSTKPSNCVICHVVQRKFNIGSYTRLVEKLITANQGNCNELFRAATKRENNEVLEALRKRELESIQIEFHRSCFRRFANILCREKKTPENSQRLKLEKPFQYVCDIVDAKILARNEVMKIDTLRRIFVKAVKDMCNIELENYRNSALKRRLFNRYERRLKYVSYNNNHCQIVMAESCQEVPTTSSDLQRVPLDVEIPSDSELLKDNDDDADTNDNGELDFGNFSSEEENQNSNQEYQPLKNFKPHGLEIDYEQLFIASQQIKKIINSVMPFFNSPIEDIDRTQKFVPQPLFTFIAWCVNASDEYNFSMDQIPTDLKQKILSISQSMILTQSKTKTIPKQDEPCHKQIKSSVNTVVNSVDNGYDDSDSSGEEWVP